MKDYLMTRISRVISEYLKEINSDTCTCNNYPYDHDRLCKCVHCATDFERLVEIITELNIECPMCEHLINIKDLRTLNNCPVCKLSFCRERTDENSLCLKCLETPP